MLITDSYLLWYKVTTYLRTKLSLLRLLTQAPFNFKKSSLSQSKDFF